MSRLSRLRPRPQIQRNRGEWTFRHVQHLNNVTSSGTTHISRLFRFPTNHTSCQKQEETREENREKDKEIDVQLVLTGEDDAVGDFFVILEGIDGLQDQVETC